MTQISNPTHQDELKAIENFEAETNYDASYMKEMLEHAPEALAVFNAFIPMAGHRKHAPLVPYYVAKLTAYHYCDCGPCFQLAISYAKQEGIDPEILSYIAFGKGELSSKNRLVNEFTLAVLRNDLNCEDLRRDLEFDLGKAAVIEIALAIAAPQIFPVMKRAMGHYKSCQRVSLDL